MQKIKSFKEYLAEGEAEIAKPDAAKEEQPEYSEDDTTQAFLEIKDGLESCIVALESLHKKLEGTNISQEKIDNILAELKGYLQNVEDESDISNKSNQTKN